MTIQTAIRRFDEGPAEAYPRLFPGDAAKAHEALEWRFRSNPHGSPLFAVAEDEGRIVGMITLIPTRLAGVQGGLAYQAIDTVVDEAYRGRGIFVSLGTAAQDPAAQAGCLLWGFPNASAARGWYGRLGWTNFGAVPLLMRPLRSSFLLGRLHPRLRMVDFPLIRGGAPCGEVYCDGARLSADFDGLWRLTAQQFGIAVDRSGEWMRWRLMDKPGTSYRCVGIKRGAGDLGAFVASKVDDKHGARICYVMEAIGRVDCRRELTQLLRAELALAAEAGAEVALAWCPNWTPNYAAYRKAGFVPFPPRLRPVEINFGARALRPQCASAALPGARWYVSFLDSDTN